MKTAKDMTGMGFKPIKQVELTNYLLNNLQQFKLTPTAKLVLLYLSGCYNPKNADVFPKQKTIAEKMGISEASVIRAIAELHKEGLIISERKYTNRYRFTSRLVTECPKVDFFEADKMQDANLQNERTETCNLQAPIHEQLNEQLKEQSDGLKSSKISLADFEKLKNYATSKGAKNPVAYAKKIIENGNTQEILNQIAEPEKIKEKAQKRIAETQDKIKEAEEAKKSACPPPQAWFELREKLFKK